MGDLYRLLLNQERVFPATAPAALLFAGIANFCDDEDLRVREAALATTALLLADPALASSVPGYAPAVRKVLAVSVDSYTS
ncbi:hypothetical protein ACFXB3_01130 [Streptomyces sp. NPDC059447]|uniref:hypothetical protein n=1 Tax=Streptomyces sp. NPDC059447 TaxID=3346834 RepID=UPI0036ABB694